MNQLTIIDNPENLGTIANGSDGAVCKPVPTISCEESLVIAKTAFSL